MSSQTTETLLPREQNRPAPLMTDQLLASTDTVDDHGHQAVEAAPPESAKLKNNRPKAILFQNLFCIFQTAYLASAKHGIGTLKVNPLDQVISRNLLTGTVSYLIACYCRESFFVKENMRWKLFLRSFVGVFGNTSMTFGIALVPLVCQSTLQGTSPFWAAIFAFFIVGETLSCFMLVCMAVAFSGVVLIATSPYLESQEGAATE